MKKYLFIMFGVMLSGCMLMSQAAGGLSVGLERLHALTFSGKHLAIRVESYGCTKAGDFDVRVEGGNTLAIIRKKADHCRAMPRIIELQLPMADLIVRDYQVKNNFAYRP